MLRDGTSKIVQSHEQRQLRGTPVEVLHLNDGKAIVIAHNALAVYKSAAAIDDDFGQGLLDICDLPPDVFPSGNAPKLIEHNAGFVGLSHDRALLILPNGIKMYANKNDALYNRSAIANLKLQ